MVMCKKLIILLTLMTSVFVFSACGSGSLLSDNDMDIYEKIHTYYNNMESYSARVKFTVFSNKTQNTYTAEQKALGNDKFYVKVSSEDSGLSVTTISDGEKTKTVADGTDYSITLPTTEKLNLMFINSFFKTYYSSEDTSLAVNNSDNTGNTTLLETVLSPMTTGAAKVTLSIDNKTLSPVCLTVFTLEGTPAIKAEFSDFKYNDKSISINDFTTD